MALLKKLAHSFFFPLFLFFLFFSVSERTLGFINSNRGEIVEDNLFSYDQTELPTSL